MDYREWPWDTLQFLLLLLGIDSDSAGAAMTDAPRTSPFEVLSKHGERQMEKQLRKEEETMLASDKQMLKYARTKLKVDRLNNRVGYGFLLVLACAAPFYLKWQVGLLYTKYIDPYTATGEPPAKDSKNERWKGGEVRRKRELEAAKQAKESAGAGVADPPVKSWVMSNSKTAKPADGESLSKQ